MQFFWWGGGGGGHYDLNEYGELGKGETFQTFPSLVLFSLGLRGSVKNHSLEPMHTKIVSQMLELSDQNLWSADQPSSFSPP